MYATIGYWQRQVVNGNLNKPYGFAQLRLSRKTSLAVLYGYTVAVNSFPTTTPPLFVRHK